MRPRWLRRLVTARRAAERADVGPVDRDVVDRARRQRRIVFEGCALHPESIGPRGDLRARGTREAECDGEDSERRAQEDRARIPNRGVHRSPPCGVSRKRPDPCFSRKTARRLKLTTVGVCAPKAKPRKRRLPRTGLAPWSFTGSGVGNRRALTVVPARA